VEPRSQPPRTSHIGIAVAYNVWQYYQVTGDLAYLIDYGTEMLAEIARFWVSRTTYDEQHDRYHINGVIGPTSSIRAIPTDRTTESTTTPTPM
jgi:trehalose/maltose hydrolase-like predicted phosphorylase